MAVVGSRRMAGAGSICAASVGHGTAAFLFFPGSEQYQEIIRELYPGGMEEEVRNPVGRHVLYAYVIKSQIIGSDSQPR